MEKPHMEISVRSYLTAGMTAVVGAGAIAMAPASPSAALQSVALPAPAVAEIVLTGTSFPLEQIWTLLQSAGGGGLQGIVNVVFGAVGTEFAAQALPLVTAALNDVATYLGAAVTDVFGSGGLQVDFPAILSGVGTALGGGDFPGALQALTGGLTAPVTHLIKTVFGTDFQAFLTTKVGTVLGALPELLRSAVQKVLGLDIKPVTDAITNLLSGLLPTAGASVPAASVALAAAAEAPAIVSTVPAIRSTDHPTVPTGVVVEAPAAPAAGVAAAPATSAEAAPGEAASVDVPAVADVRAVAGDPTVEAPALSEAAVEVAAEPDTAVTSSPVARRGSVASVADAGKAAAGHRGASEASPSAAQRAGR
jgi:hypothetical protein